ncbi:MAG: hypothetical protein Q9171_005468 [Xanthocarpia ochracea]
MPALPDRSRSSKAASSKELEGSPGKGLRPAPRYHSPSSLARIRIKNRRKHFLDSNPGYFVSPSLELAGPLAPQNPLAYDRLIRRFQTAAEREADGKKKGYGGILEADLWRSEAKVDALSKNGNDGQEMSYGRNANGEIIAEEKDEVPTSKEEGERRWREQVELRFLRGEDADFNYRTVDGNDQYDAPEESRDIQDQWFEEEEEDSTARPHSTLEGQTGIQDF